MTNNKMLGNYGENLAVMWLQKQGYKILLRNWKFGRLEIDIIAEKENVIHLFEVKTRRGSRYGFPESSISQNKKQTMMAAAMALLEEKNYEMVQINVLT